MQQYLAYVRVDKRLAPRTLALYSDDLRRLQQAAQPLRLALLQLQPFHIQQQVARLHSQGHNPRGIARILSAWRGFYRWAVRQGLASTNPVQDVRGPKAARPLPKALSADEAVQLAAWRKPPAEPGSRGAAQEQWLQLRDAAMTELLYSSGLRISELLGLQVQASAAAQQQGQGWIDWEEGMAHVLGKGGKRRSVPVGRAALQALREWLQVRHLLLPAEQQAQTALFISRQGQRLSAQNAWKRLRQRSQQAGLSTPVHPHMLRHSFASHLLQSSGDLRGVQDMLGHTHIGTTQIYTRLDFQHLARVYDAAHPRAHRGGTQPRQRPAPDGPTAGAADPATAGGAEVDPIAPTDGGRA